MTADVGYPEPSHAWWITFDPLVAAVTVLSARVLYEPMLWSLMTVAATMTVGRFFCGWICPLGTVLDLTDRFIWKRRESSFLDELRPRAKWKQYILVVLLGSSILGVSTGLALDPLVLFTRTVETVLVPFVMWAGYGLLHGVRLVPGQEALSVPALEAPPLYGWMTVTTVLFIGIIWLGKIERRFWCRNLCPLGALLGWLGRTGLLRRYVDDGCTSCTRCARDCPMGAIPKDFTQTHKGECILCLRCQNICAGGNVHFGRKGKHTAAGFVPERRHALAAIAGGVGMGLLARGGTHAAPRPAGHIRPPGAVPEDEFLSRCTRCLACVQTCPTHGLQPSGAEAGWEGIWTPVLVPAVGGCEEPCHACGQVCPTGAIRHLSHEEKSFAKMGTARIIEARCLAWEELKPCLVCDEVCPYDAIDFRVITDFRGTQRRPTVMEDKCTGCGLCENACPVTDARAIVVEHYAEERLSTGSYITPAKRRLREVQDDRNVDYLREYRSGTQEQDSTVPDDEPLPPGFILD